MYIVRVIFKEYPFLRMNCLCCKDKDISISEACASIHIYIYSSV